MIAEWQSLQGAHVQKVHQPWPHAIILELYSPPQRSDWLISAHPRYPRLHRTWQRFSNPSTPPLFCLWLRTRIQGAILQEVQILASQVSQFQFNTPETHFFLVWEANGEASNLLLLDAQKNLLMALFNPNQPGRSLAQGQAYQLPIHWAKSSLPPDLPHSPQEQDRFWLQLESFGRLSERQSEYRRHFKSLRKKLSRRLIHQEEDLAHCQQAGRYQQWGELLKPHLGQILLGQRAIEVIDYFMEELPLTSIPLKADLTPQENLSALFTKAEKLRKALPHVEQRLWQTLEEQEKLTETEKKLESLTSVEAFQAWEHELPRAWKFTSRSKPQSHEGPAEPLTRLSSEGIPILVGRNNRQNEEVTFHWARGNDWWLHVQGAPGAHVIVKYPKSPLPAQTLWEAAQLAGYYSKQRPNGKMEVDYTQRKYVKKLKGSAPGKVTYSQNQTLFVELDEALLKRLLEQDRLEDSPGEESLT